MSVYGDYAHEWDEYRAVPTDWQGSELEAADFLGFPSRLILALVARLEPSIPGMRKDGRLTAHGLMVLRENLRIRGL